MAFTSITPIKIGIKFDPPAIVLLYRDVSKLRSRTMPTKDLDILTPVPNYVENFKNNSKNKKYFEKISNDKLEKMIFILQDSMKGYTLEESLDRSKKNNNLDDSDLRSESKSKNDYDDDDFHDTDDEKPSVSTLDEVKAEKNKPQSIFETRKISADPISKSTALDLLSTQMKAVKSNFYDFEDEVEDEILNSNPNQDDDDDDNDDELLNFAKKSDKNDEDKIETAKSDDESSSSSF